MISEEDVLDVLRHVIDPELGINVVDLGLVYSASVDDGRIHIAMTMTTPACPMHSYLTDEARNLLMEELEGVEAVKVDLVWDPPWDPMMMSEAAKQQLGFSGR
jgi:metal-sulfur cluster biosynthetic enzyme